MKKVSIVLATILLAVLPMKAQQVVNDNFQQVKVHYRTPDLKTSTTVIDGTTYSLLAIDGYANGGEIGSPALPQLNSMLVIPFCKGMQISVENAVYDTVALPSDATLLPMQPSRSKSDDTHHDIVIDSKVYTTPGFHGELATVEYIGIARDRNLATLTFSPVLVDVMNNKAVVCLSADITVRYIGADEQATLDHFQRYYTPAYSIGTTLNTLLSPKYVSNATPIRMAVLAHSSLRCDKLEQFFDWKRSQGFRVDVFYIDELGITAPAAIDAMLANLYTNATSADPAPAYLLVVGDVDQVPSHSSKLSSSYNDHITDLYYTTWTNGDKVSDCYFGRFSATDTTTLGGIIDKTLLYEQYTFEDDSYLSRAALIAGEDNGLHSESGWFVDHAWIYADPAMDYIAYNYVNASNGYTDVTYYKNDVEYAPTGVTVSGYCSANNAAATLSSLYNTGIGLINYSAHGDWNCWHKPSFTVQNANNMTNNNMPSFMIGNCCLTNKFEKATCFGEALLRKGNNAGAIGYIGGTNSTYWTEDFYWAVGVRSNVTHTLPPNYNASNLGVYDRLFHTHGEDFSTSISTAGHIILYGNMTVQNSSSSLKDYYWEIYQLMGDPSLMPWMGCAAEPYADIANSSAGITVHTMPNAYVAIVNPDDSNRVLAATFANADGDATFSGTFNSNCKMSISAQNYKPLSIGLANMAIETIRQASVSVYPNPANERCLISCDGMKSLQLINSLGQTVRQHGCHGSSFELNLQGLTPGIYLLRISTSTGMATEKIIVQ